MTAPAAALIQRQTARRAAGRDAVQPAQQSHASARTVHANPGFAAHLAHGSPTGQADRSPHLAGRLAAPDNDTRPAKTAPPRPSTREAVPSGKPATEPQIEPATEPATETATGKALPDKRQAPAHPAAQAVVAILNARPAAEPEIAAASGTASDADAATAGALLPDLSALGAAPALPLPASSLPASSLPAPHLPTGTPPAPAAQVQAGTAARLGAAPPLTAAREAARPAASKPEPAAANAVAAAPAASLTPGSLPTAAFVLERDGPIPAAPDTAAADPAAKPAEPQTAARAEPSTLAALTATADPARPAQRKTRPEADAVLPSAASGTAETAGAAAMALATSGTQPATGAPGTGQVGTGQVGTQPAAAQPAEGIGFDALVDSIARARDGAADGFATGFTNGAPVAVAMRHAEFGRISLRFKTDADGLSVAMASADPAFAPAVAAAHAAEAASRNQPSDTGSSPDNDLSGTQTQSGARQQRDGQAHDGQAHDGQPHDGQTQSRVSAAPSRNGSGPRGGEALADERRGGIFA
jgi:Meckel syndrome type 1 protein